jgi:hypothetical protein
VSGAPAAGRLGLDLLGVVAQTLGARRGWAFAVGLTPGPGAHRGGAPAGHSLGLAATFRLSPAP